MKTKHQKKKTKKSLGKCFYFSLLSDQGIENQQKKKKKTIAYWNSLVEFSAFIHFLSFRLFYDHLNSFIVSRHCYLLRTICNSR